MIRTREKAGGSRRSLVSSAALGTAVALALGGLVATPAIAAPSGSATGTGTNQAGRTATLTVSPAQGLSVSGPSELSLTGANYATTNSWESNFGGAYILFGVVTPTNAADPGSWAPSKGGLSGTNYDYASGAGVYQTMVNYPGNTTEPDVSYMDENGNWSGTLAIPGPQFTSQAGNAIDCLVQQCGVITIGAHGSQSAGVEVFTPVVFETPAAPATETTTTFTAASPASNAVQSAGVDLTATVAPSDAAGTVEFLVGETVVGSAAVASGTAQTVSTTVPAGLQTISARFVPSDEAAFTASTAAATKQVRVVDTARIIGDISVGDAAERITDAELVWSVTNHTASGTSVHKKSVLSGNVTLTEAETEAARDFVFTGGTGSTDAAGNSVIEFTGSIQLATRTNDVQKIVLTDPVLRTNAAGDGYLTADFSGDSPNGAYTPVQDVTIANVRGIAPITAGDATSYTVTPVWEQTAAGTWAASYTQSFPNEFVTLINSAVRTDFYQGGTSEAQLSKAPRAIEVEYTSAAVVPAPDPTGTSTGAPLTGTEAYMVVEPGEQLRVDGTTEVTIRGYNFDPGTATVPGTGSGGIYVGFGTMKDPSNPEKWRRSAGGTSGPLGIGDYTYGAPLFVANQNSADGDVADGMMNADGDWTATLTLPGKTIASYFGGTIDCLANQCGFFSFGAHGQIKAANEAFTPVYFAGQEPPVTPAVETTTTVAAQTSSEYPTDFAGADVTVSATVAPAAAAGTVEFFAGETSLGSAAVAEGAAQVTTQAFTGGAHQVTAVFTPADAVLYEASVSAAKTFRIIDLTPAVSGIDAGAPVKEITGATLNWSVANFVSFNSGPAKSVLGGNVVLADLPENPTVSDRANREFVFSGGAGVEDAAGNRVISFDGEVRLTSGTMPQWNFRQPEVHVNAAGDGYITALVDGQYLGSLIGGTDSSYGPVRVTVSTFTGAVTGTQEGVSSFTGSPLFEGQVAAGTWSGSYTGATFANEFLQYVNAGVRSFFLQTAQLSSSLTKIGAPIDVSYTAEDIPAPSLTVTPESGLDRAGADIAVSGTSFDTSAKPSYPGAPDAPAGVYVSLGWISNDGWKPSENAASSTRVAVATKWVQQTEETGDDYVKWTTDDLGRASFDFAFEDVNYAQALAKKPAEGDYRLAVYAIGAGGVKQAVNEFAVDVAFAPATATVTTVGAQVSGDLATDFAGADVTVSATVAPAAAAGTVEFFAGETSLGSAAVAEGAAQVTTQAFTGGAHQVTAVFTPADAVLYEASVSAAKTFRIIDLARTIADISVSAPDEQITGASLDWSIANYYSSFGYEFGKEAISGNVTVPEAISGDKEFNSNRLFSFTGGTGTRDAAGNAVIEFTGTARVTSGTASRWDFTDPQLHVNAQGEGYVTAEFSGYFSSEGLADIVYAPKRVTVATFAGAQSQTADGETSFTVTPIWEGQVAAGTWAGEYTGSFPAEFASLLYSGIRPFFTQSGTTGANLTKPVQPITLAYTAGTVPVFTGQPAGTAALVGDGATFSVAVSGDPAPSLQWQRRASATAEWADLVGETGAELTLAQVAVADGGAQFRAVATNLFGVVESEAATLTVSPGVVPVFTAQPAAVRAGEGERATFSVAVSGTPAPSLQWQRRASESEAWADIAGATGVQLVLPAVELGENGAQFRAVATSAAGIAESGVAELTVVPTAPVLTDDNTGGFEVVSIEDRTVVVDVGAEHANTLIGVTLHSDPQFLGWVPADASGLVTVTVPEGTSGDHRLSYVTGSGELLGWVAVSFGSVPVDPGTGGTDTTGGTTGTAASAQLSTTGASAAPLAFAGAAALLLLLAGAAAIVVARRRSAAKAE